MKLLKFEADWCTKCKQVDAVLNGMDLPFPVEHVDVDKSPDVLLEYGIRGIPHMILLDENHNIITRIGGVANKQQLQEAFGLQ